MKFMLLGGAGYIGRVIAERLLVEQHEVRVFDLFNFSTPKDLSPQITAICGDTRDLSIDHFCGVDIVIDLAAISNDPSGELDPRLTEAVNAVARIRSAELARRAGVRRYVLFSSCSVYGANDAIVDETSALKPLTTYALANVRAEAGVLPLITEDFSVTILRAGTVFGLSSSMRFDLVVNTMVLSAFENGRLTVTGGGKQYRPLVHVADLGKAAQLIAMSPTSAINGEIFNIAYANLRMEETASKVIRGIARPVELVVDASTIDRRNYRVAADKARECLGFVATHTVETGARVVYTALESGQVASSPACVRLNGYREMVNRNVS